MPRFKEESQREKGQRWGIAMIPVLFEEEIQEHPYDFSVSLRFQSYRACNPTKPHMGENLLWDPP